MDNNIINEISSTTVEAAAFFAEEISKIDPAMALQVSAVALPILTSLLLLAGAAAMIYFYTYREVKNQPADSNSHSQKNDRENPEMQEDAASDRSGVKKESAQEKISHDTNLQLIPLFLDGRGETHHQFVRYLTDGRGETHHQFVRYLTNQTGARHTPEQTCRHLLIAALGPVGAL